MWREPKHPVTVSTGSLNFHVSGAEALDLTRQNLRFP